MSKHKDVQESTDCIPWYKRKGSNNLHPVTVISNDIWLNIKDNTILLTGYGRNKRKGYSVASYNVESAGKFVKEEFENNSLREPFDLKKVKNNFLVFATYLKELKNDVGLEIVGSSKCSDTSKVILMVCAESMRRDGHRCDTNFERSLSHVRRNIYSGKKNTHFGTSGQMYGTGSVGAYHSVSNSNGMSVDEYSAKYKCDDIELSVSKNMTMWLEDCVDTIDSHCPGFVQSATVSNKSMISATTSVSKLHGPSYVMKNLIDPMKNKNACFPAAFLCVNCWTKLLHTELDCSFTAIHIPDQDHCNCTVSFELFINESENVFLWMKPHVSIIYSAYLVTHRQVATFKKGQKFYNIVAYSNKRLYECVRKSVERKVKMEYGDV